MTLLAFSSEHLLLSEILGLCLCLSSPLKYETGMLTDYGT